MFTDVLVLIALTLACGASAYGLARHRPSPDKLSLLCAWLALLSVPLFLGGVLLHNLLEALLGVEEPVFFLLAVVVAPVIFVGGLAAAGVTGLYAWVRAHAGH